MPRPRSAPRRVGATVLLLACTWILGSGCAATTGAEQASTGGRLMHTVVFWLRDDAPDGTAAALRALYTERVPEVPGVLSVFVGTPRPSQRSVVDDSFTLCASTLFVDAAAERGWQAHPIHDELKARFNDHIERVAIYDTVD